MAETTEPAEDAGRALAFLALLFGNALLAAGPWLVRLADVGPVAAGFWRLALAAPLLAVAVRWSGQPIPRLAPALWIAVIAAGLFFAADLGSWHAGIHHTKLANATLLGNFGAFVFAIYGFVAARTLPGRHQRIALGLAAAGIALLLGRSYELSPRNLIGDLLCLTAGIFYGFYLMLIDRARGLLKPWPLLLLATLIGAPFLLGFAWAFGETIWPTDWTPLLLLALGSQVIGQGLLVAAIGRFSPLLVSLVLLTQPAIAAAIGWLVYGERLGALDALGALAIAAALVLVRRG